MGWYHATCSTCNGRGWVAGNGPPRPEVRRYGCNCRLPSKDCCKASRSSPNYLPRKPCTTCGGSGEILEEG